MSKCENKWNEINSNSKERGCIHINEWHLVYVLLRRRGRDFKIPDLVWQSILISQNRGKIPSANNVWTTLCRSFDHWRSVLCLAVNWWSTAHSLWSPGTETSTFKASHPISFCVSPWNLVWIQYGMVGPEIISWSQFSLVVLRFYGWWNLLGSLQKMQFLRPHLQSLT